MEILEYQPSNTMFCSCEPKILIFPFNITSLLPSPDIQPSFHSTRHRQTRMQSLRIPLPIIPQILPENRIPNHRFERNPIVVRDIAINPLAQHVFLLGPFQSSHTQPRKVGSPACAVRLDVHEERGLDVSVNVRPIRIPVIVVFILI
jgi:hypothetical protein